MQHCFYFNKLFCFCKLFLDYNGTIILHSFKLLKY